MRHFDGNRLRSARIARQISREQLATAAGRSYYTVSGYESGRVTPSAATLGKLADALNCNVDDLFGGDER